MKTPNKTTDILLGILIFSFLFLFPFSFAKLDVKWLVLSFSIIISLIALRFYKKLYFKNMQVWGVIFALIFMIIFSIVDGKDFGGELNLPILTSTKISISTLLLFFAVLAYSIKVFSEGKIDITLHPLLVYFFFTCLCLIALIFIFYPVLYIQYRINIMLYVKHLDEILKYLLVLLLVTSYVTNETRVKRLSMGVIVSFCAVIILNLYK